MKVDRSTIDRGEWLLVVPAFGGAPLSVRIFEPLFCQRENRGCNLCHDIEVAVVRWRASHGGS
jgi:hypothetical protein